MIEMNSPKRLFLLLGDPVHHSLSPAMHNAAFRTLDIGAVYVALRVTSDMVGPVMREVSVTGGGGNITVPHKRAAAEALDRASEAVRATGACNVFWWERGEGLCGDNTDVEAFRVAAETLLSGSLAGRRVLVLGAGGAARAVVYSCVQSGVGGVDLLNRTVTRAESLVRDLGDPTQVSVLPDPGSLSGDGYDLVVNATSLGLQPSDPLPLEPGRLKSGAVLDLVYSPAETRFVRAAREAGFKAEDGRRMLVEQAALSFRLWFKREPPIETMHVAVGKGRR